jgi:hypothetical protein
MITAAVTPAVINCGTDAHAPYSADMGNKKVQISLKLNTELLRSIDDAARRKNVTRASYISWVLSESVKD